MNLLLQEGLNHSNLRKKKYYIDIRYSMCVCVCILKTYSKSNFIAMTKDYIHNI